MTRPRVVARLAGGLNFLSAIPAGVSVSILQRVFVRGDAAATANRILASESMFRLGIVAELVGIVIFVAVVLCLREVLRPVSRRLSLLLAFFGVVACGIQALDTIPDIGVLLALKGGATMAGFTTAQAQNIAYLLLRVHSSVYQVALVFYGAMSLMMGTLALRATFLPRVLGGLEMIEGLGYFTFTFTTLLAPALALRLYPLIPFATAAVGELALMLWLLVRGVNEAKWEEQARATAA